jgi:hypothetical protein
MHNNGNEIKRKKSFIREKCSWRDKQVWFIWLITSSPPFVSILSNALKEDYHLVKYSM